MSPHDMVYSSLKDERWKSRIEFLGEKDNSCSFKFNNITKDSIGDWLLTSIYISDNNIRLFLKDLIITVNGNFKIFFFYSSF